MGVSKDRYLPLKLKLRIIDSIDRDVREGIARTVRSQTLEQIAANVHADWLGLSEQQKAFAMYLAQNSGVAGYANAGPAGAQEAPDPKQMSEENPS